MAEELQRNGLGYELIAESKRVAEDWGKDLSNLNICCMYIFIYWCLLNYLGLGDPAQPFLMLI